MNNNPDPCPSSPQPSLPPVTIVRPGAWRTSHPVQASPPINPTQAKAPAPPKSLSKRGTGFGLNLADVHWRRWFVVLAIIVLVALVILNKDWILNYIMTLLLELLGVLVLVALIWLLLKRIFRC